MSRKLLIVTLATLLSLTAMTSIQAEPNSKPVDMTADTIEYDSTTGIMTAQGSVKIIQDTAVLTGPKAQYNTKTKEAVVTGGVKMVKADATLTAAEVRSYQDNYVVATGDAYLTKGENTVSGPRIDHWLDKQYSVVTGGARITMPDGYMTCDKLEAFHQEDRAEGHGSVHIVSDKRSLDATSDEATYFGSKTGQSKVILTGNAHAVQDGNILTGKTMTIYLDDKSMDAQGQTKLIVKPE